MPSTFLELSFSLSRLRKGLSITAGRPNPVMAVGVALAVVGTVIGRKIKGPQDAATHLYVIGLAPTGFGKDDPLNCGRRLLTAFDENLVGPDEFVSSQGFYRFLEHQARSCSFIDELGEQIALLNDQKGNAFVTMVLSTFKKCYNGWGDVRTAPTAGKDSVLIRCPAFSIVGFGVPDRFFGVLQQKDLSGGFVNRLLVLPFEGQKKPPEKMRTVPADPPKALIERLRALPHLSTAILDQQPDGKIPEPDSIDWADDGAAEVYRTFSLRIDELQQDEGEDENRRDLSQRVCENAIRIATNVAVGRGARAVGKRDIEFGVDFSSRSFEAMVGGVKKWMDVTITFPRLVEAVYAKCARPGGLSKRDLYRDFDKHVRRGGDELDRVISFLLNGERIERVDNLGKSNRKSPGWRALKE